ncbi:hypothetical protein MATL_G00240720 [Megalops atlanticus]|uniref:Uncharacterized protein n=1 Tax=Megalops atlanticus TaxID=7932 RepID=A0A9D3PFI6_MEGAT|nr:hypothetical protein MATL_G00240720 [Megalops atlanticus]
MDKNGKEGHIAILRFKRDGQALSTKGARGERAGKSTRLWACRKPAPERAPFHGSVPFPDDGGVFRGP